jgi:hypothetical protein
VVNPAFALVIASMLKAFYANEPAKIRSEASFYCWMFFVIAAGSLVAMTLQQVGGWGAVWGGGGRRPAPDGAAGQLPVVSRRGSAG